MDAHPDDLELELLRTGEAEAATVQHTAACVACTERLDRLGALSGAPAPVPTVPPAVEEAVLAGARAAAGRARRRRALGWTGAGMLAAAAAIVLYVVVPRTPAARADINRDGVVDILDAFALARALDQGQPARPEWDLNGDGVVDAADVERAAQTAVAVVPRSGG